MFHQEKIAVFVPASTTDPILFDAHSAIVGFETSAEEVTVYYESNRYGYAGVVTYADRARIAAGRLVTRYPTRARSVVSRSTLLQVGWFDWLASWPSTSEGARRLSGLE